MKNIIKRLFKKERSLASYRDAAEKELERVVKEHNNLVKEEKKQKEIVMRKRYRYMIDYTIRNGNGVDSRCKAIVKSKRKLLSVTSFKRIENEINEKLQISSVIVWDARLM